MTQHNVCFLTLDSQQSHWSLSIHQSHTMTATEGNAIPAVKHTHLLKQVLDLLLLSLDVLLECVELLAHDAVLSLQPQACLTLACQADL